MEKNNRTIQIGVIGSCSDLKYSKEAEQFAKELGVRFAASEIVLAYGAEKDIYSLPTVAARSAKEAGGVTVGITYEKGLSLYDDRAASIVIASGLVRGGGRETTLMLSCDAVISIAGGSGTLNEICVAYQANIPVVTVPTFGGWSSKLAGTYLDNRKRYKIEEANTAEQALAIATKLAETKI